MKFWLENVNGKKTPIGKDVFYTLEERSNLIRKNRNINYYLFSKSGFQKDLVIFSKKVTNINLIDIDDLLEI